METQSRCGTHQYSGAWNNAMRRTDRLFELIQILRDGRLHRGKDLADRLGVSVRTLYRDMDTIVASGIPVEGERGLGYMEQFMRRFMGIVEEFEGDNRT